MKKQYPIPMLPGPVSVPEDVLAAMREDYPSGTFDPDFFAQYVETGRGLARLAGTENDVVIMTGEGMLALWGALKSCLKPGMKVFSAVTGVFGEGLADMAEGLGCEVRRLRLAYNETLGDLSDVEAMIGDFRPDMVTAVHCETPSGTLNPLNGLGALAKARGALFCVDAVASWGGAPIRAGACGVDLLLGGSQKCFNAPPSMSFLAVSAPAWERIERIGYQGYDALLPWREVSKGRRCPYTPYRHGLAALHAGVRGILAEGEEAVFTRHEAAARQCRAGLKELGIRLWPAEGSVPSPTVTAALIPEGFSWPEWRDRLRERGLNAAGSLGPMDGKVFRLGHMGGQADAALMKKALHALRDALSTV